MFASGSSIGAGDQQHDFDATHLPPGFRFHPTDSEIIIDYLLKKATNPKFTSIAIGEADLNKCEPWDLHTKSKLGEEEWFFFFRRDRKYPTGMRTNRATESGYWKATGKDKEIYKKKSKNFLIGMKKTLVFYKGRAPKGEKSDWVMHEYRLEGDLSGYNFPRNAIKEEWVVCRVFHKSNVYRRNPEIDLPRVASSVDRLIEGTSLPQSKEYNEDDLKGKIILPPKNHFQNPISSWSNYYNPHPPNILYSNNNLHHQEISSHPHFVDPVRENRWLSVYSTSNPVISPSQETGVSNEIAMNETTSVYSDRDNERKEGFDQQLKDINLSPIDISDLDSFWTY